MTADPVADERVWSNRQKRRAHRACRRTRPADIIQTAADAGMPRGGC